MTIICDASSLINLALVNRLGLLKLMFGKVLIPQGVYDEVVIQGSGKIGANQVKASTFIQVVQPLNPRHIEHYTNGLSRADAQVIVLAKEQHADLIITRDKRLLKRTKQEGLIAITTTELFIEAKHKGFIKKVRPLLDQMKNKGVLIRQATYKETLRQAGEL